MGANQELSRYTQHEALNTTGEKSRHVAFLASCQPSHYSCARIVLSRFLAHEATDSKKSKFPLALLARICILTSCTNTFPGGAVVAQLTVNQRVVGSNPTRGARNFRDRRSCDLRSLLLSTSLIRSFQATDKREMQRGDFLSCARKIGASACHLRRRRQDTPALLASHTQSCNLRAPSQILICTHRRSYLCSARRRLIQQPDSFPEMSCKSGLCRLISGNEWGFSSSLAEMSPLVDSLAEMSTRSFQERVRHVQIIEKSQPINCSGRTRKDA